MSDKIKKLSTAMRLGATMRPQGFGQMFTYDEAWQVQTTCALGAAVMAVSNGEAPDKPYEVARRLFPVLASKQYGYSTLESEIANWNDARKLTREEIADKLEEMGL